MYRATTPTHTFVVPFDPELIDELIITYAQKGVVILEKHLEDVAIDGTHISLTLTQEETKLFTRGNSAQIQMRVKSGSYVHASQIMDIAVEGVLNDEVM